MDIEELIDNLDGAVMADTEVWMQDGAHAHLTKKVEAAKDAIRAHVAALEAENKRLAADLAREYKRIAHLHDTIKKLVGLETGSHYRCTGCDEIYEFPCASVVEMGSQEGDDRSDRVARFCPDCTKDGGK